MNTKQFNALTKAEKRVAVAKDVIKQVKLHKYTAESGNYVSGWEPLLLPANIEFTDDVQKQFSKLPPCKVCALGACIVSIAHLGDSLSIAEIDTPNRSSKATKKIKSIFTPHQLALIELAFEGSNKARPWSIEELGGMVSGVLATNADQYIYKYPIVSDRLLAIYKNIIKNNGTFKP